VNDSHTPTLATAEARRREARARLLATLGEAQTKLNPVTLAQDAVGNAANNVMRETVETVRTRPKLVASAAGMLALFLARKPLIRLLRQGRRDATAIDPTSLTA
jgi:hypothetical protein